MKKGRCYKNCLSTFLKIQTFSQNADQFRCFPKKICTTDQNYSYRPLCHQWGWHIPRNYEHNEKLQKTINGLRKADQWTDREG